MSLAEDLHLTLGGERHFQWRNTMPKNADIFTLRTVANKMIALRWQKAMLDTDLAALYGVEGKDACPALETVLHAPAFRAAWSHEKKEAVAVKEFLGLVGGFYAS